MYKYQTKYQILQALSTTNKMAELQALPITRRMAELQILTLQKIPQQTTLNIDVNKQIRTRLKAKSYSS